MQRPPRLVSPKALCHTLPIGPHVRERNSSGRTAAMQAWYRPNFTNAGKGAIRRLFHFSASSVGHRKEWLTLLVLDLPRPHALDVLDHTGGHRNVVELVGHLAAVGIGPSK